jgi:transmembrane sensor
MTNAIQQQANQWAIRLDAATLTPDEQSELDTWIAADRRHHGALVRARAAWLDTDRLAALERVPGSQSSELVERSQPKGRAYTPWRTFAAAASLVLAIAIGTYAYLGHHTAQTYVSEIGEIRNIQLPDGSQLTLNTNTETSIRYKETERNISLEHGEALFKVAHDPNRPFIVHANNVTIKAIGTAFTVRIDDARVDVTVTEGTVEVTRPDLPVQRLTANHRALIASSQSRTDIEPINQQTIDRQLAWREGMVSFAGEPLSSAVAEINRHSRKPIYIDNSTLAAKPVVGIFRANDAEGFANAAAATFNAEMQQTDDAIHLREPSMTQ